MNYRYRNHIIFRWLILIPEFDNARILLLPRIFSIAEKKEKHYQVGIDYIHEIKTDIQIFNSS